MAKRRRSKKWIWRLLFLILLIIAVVVCYLVWDSYFNDKKDDKGEPETSQMEQKEVRESEKEEEDEPNDGDDGKKVTQYEGENPNMASELSGVITYAGVQSGKLMIRVNIDQYLESGRCELYLKRAEGLIYSATTGIVGSASTATCEGFDVSMDEIGTGKIDIVINLSADSKTGLISGEVDI